MPAAPENAGLLLLVVLPFAGPVNVTAGALVLTVKVMADVVFPTLSDCAPARCKSRPPAAGSGIDQLPAEAGAVSVCTVEPETLEPEKTLTVIAEESPAPSPAPPRTPACCCLVVLPFAGLVNVTMGGICPGPRCVGEWSDFQRG